MHRFNAFLAALAVALAIAVAGLVHALVQCPPYCASAAAATSAGAETAESDSGCGKCRTQTQQGEAEGNEFWPAFLGYRLKITDTLLAAFTALLWWATRGLVKGADKTAERQLRASIYVEKTTLTFVDDDWKLIIRIRNFGQTPAHNVEWASKAAVVDWNGGNPKIPLPNENDTETPGSMGPQGDIFENELKGKAKTAELATKPIFLVGTIKYTTVFGSDHTTEFRYYVGGDASYDEDCKMTAAKAGNNAS